MRILHGAAIALVTILPFSALADGPKVTVTHGLTLLGKLKYPPDFKHLDYVNPNAPKGGRIKLYSIGSFDTFNPFIIKGDPAAGLGSIYESLMTTSLDEISAGYGLIAKNVEVPDDLSYVIFNLRPEARFHDGKPVTADDVVFSFNILKEKGQPHYRFYYANISKAEALTPHRVKFHFTGPPNRELPHITGQLAVLPKHYWEGRDFEKTTLEVPVGSGPYKIKRFEAGRFIEYERDKDYWAANLPVNVGRINFDEIRFEYFRDRTVALEAFKAHTYDYRTEGSSKDWATQYNFPAVKEGLVKKDEVPHARPTGMQAFVFNLRRKKFQDRALRQALAYAFDFEWSNKQLFFGQYTRTMSYFSNSDLAAGAPPTKEEIALLEPFKGKVPEEAFAKVYAPPKSDGSGNIRRNLRAATRILRKAGWKVQDGKLIDPKSGKPFEFEFLLQTGDQFERIVSPYIRNLRRLGISARIRNVDPSQYINRRRKFDFDALITTFGQSESPGNEQRDYWSSEAADRPGSRNLLGLKDDAVDALVEKIVAARDRKSLVVATRALDRVLLWNHLVVPQWHIRYDRIAYWNKFGRPEKNPKYGVDFFSWWVDPEKDKALEQGVAKLKAN